MERITLTGSRRLRAFTKAILLSALMVFSVLLGTYPILVNSSAVAPGSLPSWNPAVSCTALLTTIEGVIGNQANANGGATYGGGGFIPGIPNKQATSPPCSANGNATFGEIHPVSAWRLSSTPKTDFSLTMNPGSLSVAQGSSTTGTLTINSLNSFAGTVTLTVSVTPTIANTTSVSLNPASASIVSGGSATSILTVQASQSAPVFNYWAVRLKGISGNVTHTLLITLAITKPPPDFSLSANPSSMAVSIGSIGTSTITLTSLYNFTGTVSLTASVSPADTTASLSPVNPTASFSPAIVSLSANGTGMSTLSVSASLLTTPGTYTVAITANSGTISHSATITVTITL